MLLTVTPKLRDMDFDIISLGIRNVIVVKVALSAFLWSGNQLEVQELASSQQLFYLGTLRRLSSNPLGKVIAVPP